MMGDANDQSSESVQTRLYELNHKKSWLYHHCGLRQVAIGNPNIWVGTDLFTSIWNQWWGTHVQTVKEALDKAEKGSSQEASFSETETKQI